LILQRLNQLLQPWKQACRAALGRQRWLREGALVHEQLLDCNLPEQLQCELLETELVQLVLNEGLVLRHVHEIGATYLSVPLCQQY